MAKTYSEKEMYEKEIKNCQESLSNAYKRIKELAEEVSKLKYQILDLQIRTGKKMSAVSIQTISENPDASHIEENNIGQMDLEEYLKKNKARLKEKEKKKRK